MKQLYAQATPKRQKENRGKQYCECVASMLEVKCAPLCASASTAPESYAQSCFVFDVKQLAPHIRALVFSSDFYLFAICCFSALFNAEYESQCKESRKFGQRLIVWPNRPTK